MKHLEALSDYEILILFRGVVREALEATENKAMVLRRIENVGKPYKDVLTNRYGEPTAVSLLIDAAKLAFSERNMEKAKAKAKAKVGPCSAHAFQPADDLPPAA